MVCSVCVATYKRSQLLRKLLDSILSQNLPDTIELQVIVVDNDVGKSAEHIVKEYKGGKNICFEYFVQPEKNISLTRNVAVHNSKGEFLLFIDDDEEADKNWVINHIGALTQYNADAAFGPVVPSFHDQTPGWIREGDFFARPHSADGAYPSLLTTANCIVKAELIQSEPGPFDPTYGVTGGEDSHLFTRLKIKGARFVACNEAIVSEFIPPERTNIKWLLKKSFQTGNTVTRRMIENAHNKLIKKTELFIRAFVFEILSFILCIIFLPSKKICTKWLMKLASNAGHLIAVIGFHYKGYK
jgi:succinoglycan biosynthesis protein ExoM